MLKIHNLTRLYRDGPAGVLVIPPLLGILLIAAAFSRASGGVPVPGPEPNAEGITLEGAVLLALEHNRALRVERINPSVLETVEREEAARFDPGVSARAAHSRLRSAGGGDDASSGRYSIEAGVEKFFPGGADVSFEIEAARMDPENAEQRYETRLGVRAVQALLRGAGAEYNLARVRQAGLDTLASEYELRGFTENLVAEVEKTYWNFALAERQVEIHRQSLELAGRQLDEIAERISAGSLARTELAAARAEMALRKESLINARSALESVRLRLLRLLNFPGDDSWSSEILLADEPRAPGTGPGDPREHAAAALRMRADINQARLAFERGELEVARTKNGLLPRMDLFINLGRTGYADSFGGAVEEIDGGRFDFAAGVSFELPLGRRAPDSRHRRALLQSGRAEEAIQNISQLAELDVRLACIEAERAFLQIEATGATRALQEEKLRAETEKFRVGRSTALLVAQAQRDLVDSRISEVRAVVHYLNSLVELYRLEGTLLERRGISTGGFLYTE